MSILSECFDAISPKYIVVSQENSPFEIRCDLLRKHRLMVFDGSEYHRISVTGYLESKVSSLRIIVQGKFVYVNETSPAPIHMAFRNLNATA